MTAATRGAPDDDWTTDLPVKPADPAGTYTPERGALGWAIAVEAVEVLTNRVVALNTGLQHGIPYRLESLNSPDLIALVVTIQDIKRRLGEMEAEIARQVGREETAPSTGYLADGRAYSVKRGADRKAWEHAAWQGDVRKQVLSGTEALMVVDEDGATHEFPLFVQGMLASVQAAHGAGAPKVTVLKSLGLDVKTYCETVPGPFSVQVTGDTPE